jgi:preprotein translocase subunit YajC
MVAMSLLAVWMQAAGASSFFSFPFLLLMMVVMLAFMIVPNSRKQKQWTAKLAQIKVGDKIATNGGLRGTIFQVKDDSVVVKTYPDNVKLEVVKTAIATVTTEEEVVKS